jgi:hypothetical protein
MVHGHRWRDGHIHDLWRFIDSKTYWSVVKMQEPWFENGWPNILRHEVFCIAIVISGLTGGAIGCALLLLLKYMGVL